MARKQTCPNQHHQPATKQLIISLTPEVYDAVSRISAVYRQNRSEVIQIYLERNLQELDGLASMGEMEKEENCTFYARSNMDFAKVWNKFGE